MNSPITSNLPIEDHPDLLQEYGRALACINIVEKMVNGLIKEKDTTRDYVELEGKNFAPKIRDIKNNNWLEDNLVQRLFDLNDARVTLAHGISGEKVDPSNPDIRSGKFVISHKGEKLFNKTWLEGISNEAKELTWELYKALPKPNQGNIS